MVWSIIVLNYLVLYVLVFLRIWGVYYNGVIFVFEVKFMDVFLEI